MCKVCGIGVDLCSIARMETLLTNEHFLTRCFTAQELAYIRSRSAMAAASLAGCWAAKEAALKALGTGITLPMNEVEVLHHPSGQPYYVLHGQALAAAQGGTLLLSISHEGDMAVAFCTWQSNE